ncbi:hypothetical protein ACL02R_12520 [Streptomyces sp. MS19]|uniref:hypothetical protein n=1 Tax=Streptomyces sp. MS19 TaxID=3385972 RepID=UPI0039A33C43
MSEEEAEEWAAHWTESMARTAQARIDIGTVRARFFHCVGENYEMADDGRFTHRYSVWADIEPERRAEAVRAIRADLEERGLEIQGYRSDPSEDPANALDAWHPQDHQGVTVQDSGASQLLFVVKTPCLLPPGVEQQQL